MSKKQKKQEEPKNTEKTVHASDLLQEQLQKASQEAAEFKDKYFRTLAEMENMRKRLQQEKMEMMLYAKGQVIKDILMPLDQLEKALEHTDNLTPELKNWAVGFKMIASQFSQVLENLGVVPFSAKGKPFDPHLHEAMEMVETEDHPDNTVLEEVSKGYLLKESVLRPAQVKVSKQPKKEPLGVHKTCCSAEKTTDRPCCQNSKCCASDEAKNIDKEEEKNHE